MSLLKKIVGGAKKAVNKVGDIIQDTSKLAVNAVVPIKNPYTAEDFNTKFGKGFSKVQGVTDDIGTGVVTALIVGKSAGAIKTNQPEQINDTKVSNISDGGLIPEPAATPSSNLLGSDLITTAVQAPSMPSNQVNNPMLNNLVSQNPPTFAGALFNVLGGAIAQRVTGASAQQTVQKAQAATFKSSAPQSLGTGTTSQPSNTPWYTKPMNIIGIALGVIGVLFTLSKMFSRRR